MSSTTSINSQTNLVTNQNRLPGQKELGKDAFLQMLVAQLKNQDPINPLDSAQFAAQLAQFNSVEQLINLNESMGAMAVQQELIGAGLSNTLAASLTGKVVKVRTDQVHLEGNSTTDVRFNLASRAESVQIRVMDANGSVIRTETLSGVSSGNNSWTWNGRSNTGVRAPEGAYKVEVVASNGDTPVTAYAFSEGTATRVKYTAEGVQLQVNGVFVNLSEIEEIGQ